jgi:hypothetical protein
MTTNGREHLRVHPKAIYEIYGRKKAMATFQAQSEINMSKNLPVPVTIATL